MEHDLFRKPVSTFRDHALIARTATDSAANRSEDFPPRRARIAAQLQQRGPLEFFSQPRLIVY
jgi:hypothetical protein